MMDTAQENVQAEIVVRCKGIYTHVRVRYFASAIIIAWGFMDRKKFVGMSREYLKLSENPELKGLFRKGAWNLNILRALVKQIDDDAPAGGLALN